MRARRPIAEQHEAQDRGQNYRGDKRNDEKGKREEANQGRGEEVKLFFDSKRPGNDEPGPGKVRHADENVLEKEKLDRNAEQIAGSNAKAAGEKHEHNDGGGGEKKSPEVVDRQDAKDAAHIKGAEVVRRVTGVQKNAADQEAGKNEEKGHPAPANGEGREKSMRPETERGVVGLADVVAKNDEKNGEPAGAVELQDAAGGIGGG